MPTSNNITGAGRQWKREVYPRSGLECHRVRGFIHIERTGNGAVQRFRPGEEAQRKLPLLLPPHVSDCLGAGPAHRRRPLLDAKPPAAKLRRFVRAHDERILCNPLSAKDVPRRNAVGRRIPPVVVRPDGRALTPERT